MTQPVGTCKDCRFVNIETIQNNLVHVCKHSPPTVYPFVVMTKKGPTVVGQWSGWPATNGDTDWCHQFQPARPIIMKDHT